MGALTTANSTQAAQALPTASAPSLIVGGVGNQMNPSLVGDTLVYDDCPLPYQPCTLSAYDFATQSSYQVATNVEYIDGQNSVQRTDGVTATWIEGDDQNLRTTRLADIYTPDYLYMPGQTCVLHNQIARPMATSSCSIYRQPKRAPYPTTSSIRAIPLPTAR
jgi:hypothetical protein